ncbi:RES family NAD+ phosphorylase [Celeribacter halophilus]|uniref:RES family NAD+ phosphorylase n=1 Tax=Celeribacter halophilus TaxID=576117 RepID=UPI003A93DFE1
MKQTEISDRGLVRLLPATYHKPPPLRGLVDTNDEMESLTCGRLLAERGRNPHLDPRELAWQRRSRGLIYPSVRVPALGGNCLVCFEPHAIQNVRPDASWDLVWGGTPHYSIMAVG